MRVADFFCGGGGFSEGFRQAGFDIVFAVDKWSPAVTTYKGNKPGVNCILDDIIRISELEDEEFEKLVPDSEVIIGSPPCQAFSQSNKSGNGEKGSGIKLINAFLRIIARKKWKENSVLKYWVLENVPNSQKYIQEIYTAEDLGLEGEYKLLTKEESNGIYNAKHFGAPTNRKRYLCGNFPRPKTTHTQDNSLKLKDVLLSLGTPLLKDKSTITDINYPELTLPIEEVTDHQYIYELQPFEWETSKRLKQDRGYMGRMSFPENTDKPARTVMATMSSSSRESMILGYGHQKYRLPTVREAASMMSFPIDYRFYGVSKGIKHRLIGNAVPPKLSYAIAKAIVLAEEQEMPLGYIKLAQDPNIKFYNLNGIKFPYKKEKPKREIAKFKYHIPYLILSAYRVELTNYNSDFENKLFRWDVEIHYSQGRKRANIFIPKIEVSDIPNKYTKLINRWIEDFCPNIVSFNKFQELFCMTTVQKEEMNGIGPYELLNNVKKFLIDNLSEKSQKEVLTISDNPEQLPTAIVIGYYILKKIIKTMEGLK